jgi:hypothetical protein
MLRQRKALPGPDKKLDPAIGNKRLPARRWIVERMLA